MGLKPLHPQQLYKRCPLTSLEFSTTTELNEHTNHFGQHRAAAALRFGIGIRKKGYNLFVTGIPGSGRHTMVHEFLNRQAPNETSPSDWIYVYNFDDMHKPVAIELPAGLGRKLRDDMKKLIEAVSVDIPAAFENENYKLRLEEIEDEIREQNEKDLQDLEKEAAAKNVTIIHTPAGLAIAPRKDGQVLGPDEFKRLPQDKRDLIQETVAELQDKLEKLVKRFVERKHLLRERIKQLNREVAEFAVAHLVDILKSQYATFPRVISYLEAVKHDLMDNAEVFHKKERPMTSLGLEREGQEISARYRINLVIDNHDTQGAPVIYEDHATYPNLVGRVEYRSQWGALVTDFDLIKAGALHKANGGYLILDAHKLLMQPYAWEGLKRILYAGEIRIESLAQVYGLVSTVSLQPAPIPLKVKVVLIGDPWLYHILSQLDPDFAELFKVMVDFEDRLAIDEDSKLQYAKLVGSIVREEELLVFDKTAVARVIEFSSRYVSDSERLSAHIRSLADLLREADFWAREKKHEVVTAEDVQCALDRQEERLSRLRDRLHEEIQRSTVLIDTKGKRIGQVNGLSIINLGNFSFGQPSRITSTARLGEGDVIDIEREAKLGGKIHSKGVLILASFLADKYSKRLPLSIAASLVFEQSYGMIEGDSASVAELCALLSALAEVPLKQSLAVTGSVNQKGEVQAIGGVNEKIEGFFDICKGRGLTGEQGVIIPAANVKNLMLRRDVVEACREETFRVWAVTNVDEVIEILSGIPAGAMDDQRNFPEGSFNGKVCSNLNELMIIRQRLAKEISSDSQTGVT